MVRFGEYELDVGRRELRRGSVVVHLEPQAFDLLVYLVEHRDRVVPKHELLDGVWGHAFLSEANLTTRIKEVRRAVGDDGAQQHTIRNVRGHGYRFVADVADVAGGGDVVAHDRWPRLIGRDAELSAVLGLLDDSPLVTLSGPGGVGKSALARRVAAEVVATRVDGAHVVELSPLEPGEVLAGITQVMHLLLDGSRPEDTVRGIARSDALLVLDNCEHVIDEVASLVDRFLTVPGCRLGVLATSRVPLGLSGEARLAVGPLDVGAARALFSTRAQALTAARRTTDIDEQQIDRLVVALDRLPLTIEMAAARLGSMTIDELEEVTATGASLRQMTHRSPTPRHRSVASVVDWSVSLLEPAQQRLFGEFSVFAGAVAASDAAAVLAPQDTWDARFGLAALAECSLLATDFEDGETRYSMLRTVRAVAEQRLEELGEAPTMHRRHADHVRDVLGEVDDLVRTPRELDGRARLDGFVDEVRSAHRWARRAEPGLASDMSASLFHAAHSGLWSEPATWARSLLDTHDANGDHNLEGALLACAGAAAHRGELALAMSYATMVADRARGRLRASALELLIDVALYEGELAEVARMAEELRCLGDDLCDAHVTAFAAVDDSLARTYAGDPDAGLRALHVDSVRLAPTDAAWVAYARAEALSAAGDSAAAAYRAAIDYGSAVGGHFVVSAALTSLAVEHARTGEIAAAFDTYSEALSTFLRRGNHTHAVTAIRNMISLLAEVGEDRGAVVLASVTAFESIRPSYGTEAQRTAEALDRIRARVGDARLATWFEEGRPLDIDEAIRLASALVEHQRQF